MTREGWIHRQGRRGAVLLALGFALLCGTDARAAADASADTMRLALVPDAATLSPGDTVTVQLVVPEAGPEFNAYDAYVSYDRNVLTFLQLPNVQDQQGALMKGACMQTFHLFSVAPDSAYVEIHHSLLCAGVALTGPGVLYELRFRAKAVGADTRLRLEAEPFPGTRVIDDGVAVTPLVVEDAQIAVAGGTAAPPAPRTGLELRAAPNPFNPRTSLRFSLDAASHVRLCIHRLDGARVRTLIDGPRDAGEHQTAWDGRDDAGRAAATGCYVARLHAGGVVTTKRLSLVR